MEKLGFAIVGAAALALCACSSNNDDAVNNAELNQPAADDLNAIANDAALDAQENALTNQAPAPAANAEENAAAPANRTNPSEDEEQNVDGM